MKVKFNFQSALLAIWIVCTVCMGSGVFADSVSVQIPLTGDYTFSNSNQAVKIQGFGNIKIPGAPQLPARIFAIAIPPGAQFDSFVVRSGSQEILPGDYNIAPAPIPRAISDRKPDQNPIEKERFIKNNNRIYQSNALYPSEIGEFVRTAGFRKYNLVDIRICPIQYQPKSGKLVYHSDITVEVHYTPSKVQLNQNLMTDHFLRMERRASDLILNYDEVQQLYPSVNNSRGLHEFVIITTAALESSVTDLENWEVIKGKTSTTVTVEWISSNYPGVDLAQKMRNFLHEKYPAGEWGIEDVCLIGHHSDVPMRQIADDPDTDLYFAELSLPDDQSWDANSDGQYLGSGDSTDYYAEVNVGRIPWSDSTIVEHIIDKSIAFEMTDDPAFKKNILLIGTFFWPDTDNAVLMEAKVDQDWMSDWTMTRMYEDAQSSYPCDYDVSYNTVRDIWSAGSYCFVNYAGHGSATACYEYYPSQEFVDTTTCTYLNDDYPAIMFADACSNSDTNYTNIGARMLEQGGVGFVGSTRIAYGCPGWSGPDDGSSQSLDYYFSTSVTSGDYSQGAALQRGLQEVYQMNGWNYTALEMCEWSLWGNPDLGISFALSSDGTIMLDKMVYPLSATATITVRDLDLDLNPGAPDTIDVDISTTNGDQETFTLIETGNSTYVFEESVTIIEGAPVTDNGQIEVAHGDQIEALYVDADDGHGGTNVDKFATADVDGIAPVISSVEVTLVTEAEITVHWTTDEASNSSVTYGESTPDTTESDGSMGTDHMVTLTGLEQCTEYVFYVESTDEAGNTAMDDNGGVYYSEETYMLYVFLEEDMSIDPGWTYQGDWAWGQPTGNGGDPDSGYTGDNVVGYNLNGEYPSYMSVTYATTLPFDCTGAGSVNFGFWKWLGVESSTYDHANIEISNDGGSNWYVIWEHSGSSTQPTEWTYVEYDITAWAAGHSDVRIRWGMGPSDSMVEYCGWNIDDVTISFPVPCDSPILTYESHVIDDSAGNNDGQINGGETIFMPVTLGNIGLEAIGVEATLSTDNPHVTIMTDHASFPDIPQSGTGTSLTDYVFVVGEDIEDGEIIPFTLNWTCNDASGQTGFHDIIVAPDLSVSSCVILDPSPCDEDGIFDPGETVQLIVSLSNNGNGYAHNVSATLTSNHPEYITIDDDNADFPDIEGGGTGSAIVPYFTASASPTTPDPTVITFTLEIIGDGYLTTEDFDIEITTSTFIRRYNWNMDIDPGWTCEGLWEWGVPLGNDGDPSSGYTGDNVYGYNLAGDYEDNLPETYLTSEAINCSTMSDVEVRFMRWLGMESASYDHAAFRVSNNGSTWNTLWQHTGGSFTDPDWQAQQFDISAYADGEATVYLRWVMGTSDYTVTYCGWNLDDIEIWASSSEPMPTPTPPPPTNTPEPATSTPTQIPPTPTGSNTHAPTPTYPPPPTDTPYPPPPTDTPYPPSPTGSPPPTYTFSPSPTDTPVQERDMELVLEDTELYPADRFYLHYTLSNPFMTAFNADVYIVLDIYGEFWFYPSWQHMSEGIDYTTMTINPEMGYNEDVLDFIWPNAGGPVTNLYFYGAMFEAGSSTLLGTVEIIEWGYY